MKSVHNLVQLSPLFPEFFILLQGESTHMDNNSAFSLPLPITLVLLSISGSGLCWVPHFYFPLHAFKARCHMCQNSVPFNGWIVLHCVFSLRVAYPFFYWWTRPLGCCEQCHHEHLYKVPTSCFSSSGCVPKSGRAGPRDHSLFNFEELPSWSTVLHKGPNFPAFLPTFLSFLLSFFLNNGPPNGREEASRCGLFAFP